MEITVISEEENPMLHRTDVTFRVSHAEATPDRLAVRDSLAARLNKSANEVVVRKLDTKFGMRETLGEAKVYRSAEVASDVEQNHMLARNKIGQNGEPVAEAEAEAREGEADEAAEADIEADEEESEAEDVEDGEDTEEAADDADEPAEETEE